MSESINNPLAFSAVKCDNWPDYKAGKCNNSTKIFMGEHTNLHARGIYYLETNADIPFGNVKLMNSSL